MRKKTFLISLFALFFLTSYAKNTDEAILGGLQQTCTDASLQKQKVLVSDTLGSQTILEIVRDIIHDKCGCDYHDILPDRRFVEDLMLDELDYIELIMEVEREFNIFIPDEDAETFLTVGDLVDYLTENI